MNRQKDVVPFHQVIVNAAIAYQGYNASKAAKLFEQEAAKAETLSITYRILRPQFQV